MLANMRLGMVYAAMLRTDEATRSFMQALNKLDGFTSQVFAVSSERQRRAYLANVAAYIEIYASFVQQYLSNDEPSVSIVFELLFKYKSIGPELLAQQRETILAQRNPQYASKLTMLIRLRASIAEIELRRRREAVPSSVLNRLRVQRERIERDLAIALPEMKALNFQVPDSIGNLLPSRSAVIDLFLGHKYNFAAVPARVEARIGEARYLACILLCGQNDIVKLLDLGDAASVNALTESFRSSITGDDNAFSTKSDSAPLSINIMSDRTGLTSLKDTIYETVRHLTARTHVPNLECSRDRRLPRQNNSHATPKCRE